MTIMDPGIQTVETGGSKQKMAVRRQFHSDYKAQVVLEILKEEKTLNQLASEYGVCISQLTRWRNQGIESLAHAFNGERKSHDALKAQYEKTIEELYAQVGRLTTQVNWLKKKSGLRVE